MKKFLIIILMISSYVLAQDSSADSSKTSVLQDSLQINELIRNEIEKAKEKQTASIENWHENMPVEIKAEIQPVQENNLYSLFNNQPVHIKIFQAAAAVILVLITARRIILMLSKKAKRAFKAKIAMIREEKVIVEENPQLRTSRKQLKNNKSIFNATEKQISKSAKELNLAKGELLLAARLNLFEVGKT